MRPEAFPPLSAAEAADPALPQAPAVVHAAPQWADQLATLSGYRDRDLMDTSLVGALRDLLQPQTVAVLRCVGQPGEERWRLAAQLGLNDAAATSDSAELTPADLPALDTAPDRVQCLRQGQVLQVPAAAGGASCYFPLASDRQVVGVLELHRQVPLTATELRLVGSVLRLYGNLLGLLDYSERDTLTGLLNRKTFDESFMRMAALASGDPAPQGDAPADAAAAIAPEEARRAPRQRSVWLGVLDIDHFKRVNDQHGHLIGDEVLLLMARLMRNSFRFDDQLYRFGGEEFVVLMRCAGPGDAGQAFERLRRQVESFDFPRVGRTTVSIGFTQVRAGDTPSAAFERADQAVYVAKQQGRNQVHEHAALVRAGLLRDDVRDSAVELF